MSQSSSEIQPAETINNDLRNVNDGTSIIPFYSATNFPPNPQPLLLPELYPNLVQALKETNAARHILRTKMNERKDIIIQISTQIEDLETNLALEAETRLKLHAINQKLFEELKQIDDFTKQAEDTVNTGHQTPRTGLAPVIQQLKNLVRQWRAFRQRDHSGLLPSRNDSIND